MVLLLARLIGQQCIGQPPAAYQPPSNVELVRAYPRPVCEGGACRDITALDRPYVVGIASAGGVTCATGLILLIFYWIMLCCRSRRCCCFRSVTPKSTRRWRLLLFCCFCGTGVLTLGCIGGADNINLGAVDILNSINEAVVFFDEVDANTGQLIVQSGQYQGSADVLEAACPAVGPVPGLIGQIREAATNAQAAAEQLQTQIAGVQTQVDSFQDDAKSINFKLYVEAFSIVSILLICISCIFGAWGALRKSICTLTVASRLGIFMLFLVLLLVSVQLVLSIALADLCYTDPLAQARQMVINHAGLDAETLQNVEFYLSCDGTSPVLEFFADAEAQITAIQADLDELEPLIVGCVLPPGGAEAAFQDLRTTLTASQQSLTVIQESASCGRVNGILVLLLRDGTCVDLFAGVFALWTTQAAAGLCLLATLSLSSYMQACWKAEGELGNMDAANPLLPGAGPQQGYPPQQYPAPHGGDGEFIPVPQGESRMRQAPGWRQRV